MSDSTEKRAPEQPGRGLHTWCYDNCAVNETGPVKADQVRQSRKYDVSVSLLGQNCYQDSFAHESIPRNGNGKMFDPAHPAQEYYLEDGDGITLEADVGINMAWTQFQYSQDVEVRIHSKDASKLGPTSNVVIRPCHVTYQIFSPDDRTIVIIVPFDRRGRRFSVEFQNDLYTYRSDGEKYVHYGGTVVGEEPRNAFLVFASPFIPKDHIPSKSSPDTQVLQPGGITEKSLGSSRALYFEAGIYWMDNYGYLGKSHIKLHPNTTHVYFEPGTYIKGAIEYTTSAKNFYTIGHGVVSGENYAYMANTAKNYVAEKNDRHSLRMFSHQSVTKEQTWHCMGPTLNAPPFNTMDLFPQNPTPHEEDNEVHAQISDYKQVGAFYFQTDGPQIYAGNVQDCFWHVNDDAIKLYHSGATVERVVIWKCHNDPVIQMGWKPRQVSMTSINDLSIIHSRYFQSKTFVPSAIIGASPRYSEPKSDEKSKHVDSSKLIQVTISNVTCEGLCPALFRITPLQKYDMNINNIKIEQLLGDQTLKLGQSLVGMKISDRENTYVEGQNQLHMGLHIKNWTVNGKKVGKGEWQCNQLGQLNIHENYYGQWSIE